MSSSSSPVPPNRTLPDEILEEILHRLSKEDLERFKLVCHHWEDIIRPLQDRQRDEYKHRLNEARDQAYAIWLADFMADGETVDEAHARLKDDRGLEDLDDEYTHEFIETAEYLGGIRNYVDIGSKTRNEILGRH
ncbi:F-box family protein [Striga asiatica]|uniref:F-box family protein n=1 Tax=Striga asiatica TaxID=4170 RepID=A0A5A7PCF5_STRAF|nr:F-box family protein [Striga asiatica]